MKSLRLVPGLAVLVASLLAAACSSGGGETCYSDGDCDSLACVNNKCVECRYGDQCESGSLCLEYHCVEALVETCDGAELCSGRGQCFEKGKGYEEREGSRDQAEREDREGLEGDEGREGDEGLEDDEGERGGDGGGEEDDFICMCQDGYSGPACESCAIGYVIWPAGGTDCVEDPCYGDPCEATLFAVDGTCVQTGGLTFDCTCLEGYVWAEGKCKPTCVDADKDYYGDGPACIAPDCDDADKEINPGATEVCDGIDNDCDGDVDQALVGALCAKQQGVCKDSREACGAKDGWLDCTNASYGPDFEATEATCDGKDNDCDGKVDEELTAPACLLTEGVCKTARKACGGTDGWLVCPKSSYGSFYEMLETLCDGKDNDCDGKTDEALSAPACALQKGVCKDSVQACGGEDGWKACTSASYGTDYEVVETLCDGKDNDCDGDVDEDGACCDGVTYEGHEICDEVDNDCDGKVDEDCGPIDLATLTPYASPGWFNGGGAELGADGSVFILEFPGSMSNPMTLHILKRDGTLVSGAASLPGGMLFFARSVGGRVAVAGSVEPNSTILELSPTTGQIIGTLFATSVFMSLSAVCFDPDGGVYFGRNWSDPKVYKVTGGSTYEFFADGVGANGAMQFSADGTELYIGAWGKLGVTRAGSGNFTELSSFPNSVSLFSVKLDNDGRVYAAGGCSDMPGMCGGTNGIVRRYDPTTGKVIDFLTSASYYIRNLLFDPARNELLINSGGKWYRLLVKQD